MRTSPDEQLELRIDGLGVVIILPAAVSLV